MSQNISASNGEIPSQGSSSIANYNSLQTLDIFLHKYKVEKGKPFAYTSLKGGSYDIPESKMHVFYELYQHCFDSKQWPALTEKHTTLSPILIDLDFRQKSPERIYNEETLYRFFNVLLHCIIEHIDISEKTIEFYLLEKPDPRPSKTDGIYKDGIHLIFPNVITTPAIQHAIRKECIEQFAFSQFTNPIEEIYDEAVIEKNNWFIYGSKKPDEEHPWLVTYKYIVTWHDAPNLETIKIQDPYDASFIKMFSIRGKNEACCLTEKGLEVLKNLQKPKNVVRALQPIDVDFPVVVKLVDLLCEERSNDYNTWIRVGWCLYNIDDSSRMLPVWHKFSAKSYKYSEYECEKMWTSFNKQEDGVKMGSLVEWAKQDAGADKVLKIIGNIMFGENTNATLDMIMSSSKVHSYTTVKRVFEKTQFKLINSSAYVTIDDDEVIIRKFADFKQAYMNLSCIVQKKNDKGELVDEEVCFVDKWIRDRTIKTFKRIDFLPPPMNCHPGVFNTWRGFAIDKIDAASSNNVEPFLNHISVLVNHDKKSKQYFTNYLAHIVQYPGALPGVCIIFKSKQGCGKSMFLDLFSKIIGQEYYHETSNVEKDLLSQFANGRKDKLLVNIDEASGKVTFKFIEEIKNMITSSRINYEPKGVNRFTISNFNRFIGTTNNDLPFKIEEDDRRFVVFECSNEKKNDRKYFREFIEYMSNVSNQKAIMEYLRSIKNLDSFDWVTERPETTIYKQMKYGCSCYVLRYLEFIYRTHMHTRSITMSATEMFEGFNRWLEECKLHNVSYNLYSFGSKRNEYMSETDAIKTIASKKCTNIEFDIQKLRGFLARKGVLIDGMESLF